MSPAKKKSKSPAKKNLKVVAKKTARGIAKKKAPVTKGRQTKSVAGKKAANQDVKKIKGALRKTTTGSLARNIKSAVKKQAANPLSKKNKSAAQEVSIPESTMRSNDSHATPEVIKHDEIIPSVPEHNVMHPDIIEEHKKSEHQFENKEEVVMNQENQRVKSAMANRQKRVFRTPHR